MAGRPLFHGLDFSVPLPTPPQTSHLLLLLHWSPCSQKQGELGKGTLSPARSSVSCLSGCWRGAETGALPLDNSPEPRLQTCLSASPHSLCAVLATPGAAFVFAFVLATGHLAWREFYSFLFVSAGRGWQTSTKFFPESAWGWPLS